MRISRLVGVTLLALALSAIVSTTAFAAEVLWRYLPGTASTTFTGKSGKATLQVKEGLSITAPSSSMTGELTGPTLATGIFTYTKVTSAGLPVNSLGDASGVVLVAGILHNCMIKAGDNGDRIKLSSPVHLEVPSTKLLMLISGAIIVLTKGARGFLFTLAAEQKGGVQAIEKCEGAASDTLKTSIDGGAEIQSGFEAQEGSITFKVEQELMEN